MPTALAVPAADRLDAYRAALARGYLPSNVDGERIARAHIAAIATDAAAFLASLTDPEARGAPVRLPDGTLVPRLPGFTRWIVDGDAFVGQINLRWQVGTDELPPHVLGHVGYVIAPWHRRRGHASAALALLLPLARAVGLSRVDLTTDPDNLASQKVIRANGGVLVGRFNKTAAYGGDESLLYRIVL
jgi:predicted acetyltransferase